MLFKATLVTFLAALASAVPTATAEPDMTPTQLEKRQSSQGAGFAFLYTQPNYKGTGLIVNSHQNEANYCQQFQPIFNGTLTVKSYLAYQIYLIGYKGANCNGDAILIYAGKQTTNNTNSNYQNLLSFKPIFIG